MKTLIAIVALTAALLAGCSAPDNNRPTGSGSGAEGNISKLADEARDLSAEISEWGANADKRPKATCDELPEMEAKTDRLHDIQRELADDNENNRGLVRTLKLLDQGMADMDTYCKAAFTPQ